MNYTPDGRFSLNGPTPEEKEQRAKFEADRAANAAKSAALAAACEADLKQRVRRRYAGLPNADFERLWPTIRDAELIAEAKRLAETPRPSDTMYSQF